MVFGLSAKKTAIIVNEDLEMSKGKTVAQACHAMAQIDSSGRETCITLKADKEEMLAIEDKAEDLQVVTVNDAGRTEIEPGSHTVTALYGDKSEVGKLTKYLDLL